MSSYHILRPPANRNLVTPRAANWLCRLGNHSGEIQFAMRKIQGDARGGPFFSGGAAIAAQTQRRAVGTSPASVASDQS